MTELLSGVELPKRFVLYRKVDDSGVSGTGVVCWGTEFPDGRVATRWCVEGVNAQTAVFDCMEDVERIHGHGGHTIVLWAD